MRLRRRQTHLPYLDEQEEAWEILLNLAINQYPVRETLRNILKAADDYIEDNPDTSELR